MTQRSQRKWLVFVTIGIGVYAWVVDASAINVALPSISSHFHASLPTVQWVVLGYTLAVTALLIPMGKAADYVGRKRLYLLGFITYVVGALLASIAQDVNGLLIARLIQAVGAAAVQGNGMAMAVAAFPAKERGIMLGCYSLTVGVAATTGPVFGGLLIDAFGWRSVLVTTGALGLVALLMGQAILPSGTRPISRHGPKVDWAGMTIAPITMVSLFLIPSRGPVVGWTSPILFLTSAVAGVGLVAFIVAELKASNPVIDLRMFANRRFSLGTMAVFLTFSGLSGSMFILPFYLQGVLDLSASAAGILTTPFAVMMGIAAPIAGRVSDRIGYRIPATAGMSVCCVSLFALSSVGLYTDVWLVAGLTALMGLGMGMFSAPNSSSILGSVEERYQAVVAGLIALLRNMGQVAGVAFTTLIVTLGITTLGLAPDLGVLREGGSAADPLLVEGFISGLRRTYLVMAGVLAVAALISVVPTQATAQQQVEGAR